MKLSVCICSLESRIETRKPLVTLLSNYIGDSDDTPYSKEYVNTALIEKWTNENVEIIVATDNKQISLGAKRNICVEQSAGDYVTFIDDDDVVEDNYVSLLLNAIKTQADCICFKSMYYHNNKAVKPVLFDVSYAGNYEDADYYYRLPNPKMCFKRELLEKTRWSDITFGEDTDFAIRVQPLIKSQRLIPLILYHHFYNTQITESNN